MNDVFEQLAPLAQTKKQQTAVAKFVEKGFKFTRQPDAQKFTFLVYDFFVAGNMPAVQLCIDYLVAQGYPTAENKKQFLNWIFMEPIYYLKYFISDASIQKKLHHDILNLWYESTKRQILEHDKGKHDEAYIDAWVKANVNKTLSIIRSGETIASRKEDVAKHSRTLNVYVCLMSIAVHCSIRLRLPKASRSSQPKPKTISPYLRICIKKSIR